MKGSHTAEVNYRPQAGHTQFKRLGGHTHPAGNAIFSPGVSHDEMFDKTQNHQWHTLNLCTVVIEVITCAECIMECFKH